ncbi:hypothetical protein ISN76_04890 [Dyella halodurans]|uniref:Uncharacterized protein n=1 Tax=Dyella halodurans TaxID=1920171 RepID=A0ABV9C138_9GAMM|nr:hypothetical protein [Dyella halodurans]
MIEPSPGVPPHIALLLNEKFSFGDPVNARRKLRGMWRDLQDQAENSPREVKLQPAGFMVTMNGGLDLFSGDGSCSNFRCRIGYADQIARSIALLADQVTMQDAFSGQIMRTGRTTNQVLNKLLGDIFILQRMTPLIEAGILKFRPGMFAFCSSCFAGFQTECSSIADQLIETFGNKFSVKRHADGEAFVDTGPLYNPSVYAPVPDSFTTKGDAELVQMVVEDCVRSSLVDMYSAEKLGGAVFSNSLVGMAAVLKAEKRLVGVDGLRALDAQRAGALPWVRGLTIEQTLELRKEAGRALPRLREFLGRNLGSHPIGSNVGSTEADYVAELRDQSEEVKAELEIATSKRSSLAQNALGMAGLGICALGLATDVLTKVEGALQLLSTLGMLHQLSSPHSEQVKELRSRPGYVLVAAQDILAHANGQG